MRPSTPAPVRDVTTPALSTLSTLSTMSTTPTIAPPGWYMDPARPEQPRFWDGYQFPDRGVTVCPDGHEAPVSAVFCPECGAAVGAVPLGVLTGHAYSRRRDDHQDQVPAPGAGRTSDLSVRAAPGRAFSVHRGVRRRIARAGADVRALLRRRWSVPRPKVFRDTPVRFAPATRD